MEMLEKLNKVNEVLEKKRALDHAITLLHWDLETEAPILAVEKIGKTISYLSSESYSIVVNEEFKKLILSIEENELDEIDNKVIKEVKKEYFEKLEKIPVTEYADYSELLVRASRNWEEAKNKNDYNIFKVDLMKIINYNKKFLRYRFGDIENPYDALLDDYEPNMTTKLLDIFFDKIKLELSPLIKEIIQKKSKNSISLRANKENQQKLSHNLSTIFGFDFNKGTLKESEHPFTLNFNNKDVRITTHYYENDVLSSVYSTIHETGHAIYEQQIDEKITDTILGEGTSMGIHESQSRLYENMFGRSQIFISLLYKKLVDLNIIDKTEMQENELYKLINNVENSLIRIEADELTYSMHIMVRYEIEKFIFSNLDEITDLNYMDELANKWNNLYEKYLGIKANNFSEGILQDVHWSGGSFGYFPSYALGSAYAAQIFNAISSNIDIKSEIENESFDKINKFLKETVHKYGKSKTPLEILKICTNEDFNVDYFIEYLKNKYKKIYNID